MGNLINFGIFVNFSRLSVFKILLVFKNGSSLKSVFDFLMARFLLGADFWLVEVRILIFSLKWIV